MAKFYSKNLYQSDGLTFPLFGTKILKKKRSHKVFASLTYVCILKCLPLHFDLFKSFNIMIFVGSIFSKIEIKVIFALAAYLLPVSLRVRGRKDVKDLRKFWRGER